MKTIYSKLILMSVGVLVVGMVMLTLGLNFAYKSYIIDQNKLEMARIAEEFEALLNSEAHMNQMTQDDFVSEIIKLERYANLKVWMVPISNKTVMTTEGVDQAVVFGEIKPEELTQVISSGQPIFRASNIQSLKNEYYTLIYPIYVNEEPLMTMYLHKSVPIINQTVKEINRLAIITLILASMYAGVTLFYSAKSISDDIKKLSNGVKFVTKGNFDYEFATNRKDEIGELSANFNHMTKELKSMEDTRRKFISDLSHDLRSPITSIKGYTKGILDGTIPPEKWEKYLNIVSDESDRLTKLINDILDLSKMQDGQMTVKKEDFDMHELLLTVLDRFEERINKKQVEVHLKLAEEDVKVEGDKTLIERAVYNLMDNAVKFIDDEGMLEIQTGVKEKKLLIGIRNTGPHIPEEKLANIWQRFSKLDHSRGLEKKSSGLGLSIVKEVLDAHGEKIDVYSNEYLGVMFVFSMTRATFSGKSKNS